MATLLVSKTPQCLSCVRRLAGRKEVLSAPGSQQIRGKKRQSQEKAKINVRLLKNMPSYGRKGSILQIPAGLMRNSFYPRQQAEYITTAQLREIGEDKIVERDGSFRQSGVQEVKPKQEAILEQVEVEAPRGMVFEATDDVPAQRIDRTVEAMPTASTVVRHELSPQEATSLISRLLPTSLEFFRAPIVSSDVVRKRTSPSIPSTSAVSTQATEASRSRTSTTYTHVSTDDIARNIMAILTHDKKGAQIVVSAKDIFFVKEQDEKDRVTSLGVFEIGIAFEGSRDIVRRTITVHPDT